MAVLPEGAPFLPIRVSTQATFLPSGEMAVCSKVLAANTASIAACNGERFADALAGALVPAARGFVAGDGRGDGEPGGRVCGEHAGRGRGGGQARDVGAVRT